MKKAYLFALLTVVAFSSEAQKAITDITLSSTDNATAAYAPASDIDGLSAISASDNSFQFKAGEYTWSCYSFVSSKNETVSMTISMVDENTGEVAISGWPQAYVVKGFVDYEAKTLSIPNNQDLGPDSFDETNYFYVKSFNSSGQANSGAADVSATVGTIDGNTITFPQRDIWAIGVPDKEHLGYWTCSYKNVLTYFDPNEGWEDFGTATLIDGWVLPGYNMTPSEYPWQVEVQKSSYDDNMLRLKNPYQADGCPRPKANEGFIQFCIADPEFVIVYPNIYSGYDNKQDKLYLFNLEGYYITQGLSKDDIIKSFKNGVEAFSSYSNGVATIYNCCFDTKAPATQRYRWQDKSGNVLTDIMVSKITIDKLVSNSGIADIEIDDNNSAPVYYNLQGMRITNPAKNQLVIRSVNGKTSKVIIK